MQRPGLRTMKLKRVSKITFVQKVTSIHFHTILLSRVVYEGRSEIECPTKVQIL